MSSNLIRLCRELTDSDLPLLSYEDPLRSRLICPEYDKSAPEVKTFPPAAAPLFLLCWNISCGILNASLFPIKKDFRCCYSFTPGEHTQPHTHDYIELAYVVDGEFRQLILGREITFHSGDFCLIDRNCIHSDILQNGDSTVLFLGISRTLFDEIIQEKGTDQKITAFLQSALLKQKSLLQYLHFVPRNTSLEVEECLAALIPELKNNDAASRYICKGLLIRIFHILSTEYEISLSRENRQAMNYLLFTEVTSYIRENYASISVQDLVDRFHFQEDYYNRLIKSRTGLSYSKYVQHIRLEKACELLLSSDASIDEISVAVGYHNKGFFYKIFCERFQATPNEIRRMHLKQPPEDTTPDR